MSPVTSHTSSIRRRSAFVLSHRVLACLQLHQECQQLRIIGNAALLSLLIASGGLHSFLVRDGGRHLLSDCNNLGSKLRHTKPVVEAIVLTTAVNGKLVDHRAVEVTKKSP